MRFNDHYNLEGQHAFLGASKYHWIRYDEEKISTAYKNFLATQRGTELHAFAAECIRLGQKLKGRSNLSNYVNDAIGFGMSPEVVLYYSDNCFGTADSIYFNEKKNFLRIHDLKTGIIPAHMEQLEIYASLFCLEYHIKPVDIDMELRIYQNDEIMVHHPDHKDIESIMNTIVIFDKRIDKIKMGE